MFSTFVQTVNRITEILLVKRPNVAILHNFPNNSLKCQNGKNPISALDAPTTCKRCCYFFIYIFMSSRVNNDWCMWQFTELSLRLVNNKYVM